MREAIFDTSVLIGGLPVLGDGIERGSISVVSIGEMHAGVLSARDKPERARRQKRLAAIRQAFETLPVDDAVAESYGELLARARARARAQRRITKATDLLIVATALAHERELFTADRAQAGLARAANVPVQAPG